MSSEGEEDRISVHEDSTITLRIPPFLLNDNSNMGDEDRTATAATTPAPGPSTPVQPSIADLLAQIQQQYPDDDAFANMLRNTAASLNPSPNQSTPGPSR